MFENHTVRLVWTCHLDVPKFVFDDFRLDYIFQTHLENYKLNIIGKLQKAAVSSTFSAHRKKSSIVKKNFSDNSSGYFTYDMI